MSNEEIDPHSIVRGYLEIMYPAVDDRDTLLVYTYTYTLHRTLEACNLWENGISILLSSYSDIVGHLQEEFSIDITVPLVKDKWLQHVLSH